MVLASDESKLDVGSLSFVHVDDVVGGTDCDERQDLWDPVVFDRVR